MISFSRYVVFLVTISGATISYGQCTVTPQQWDSLAHAMQQEKWTLAEQLSTTYLQHCTTTDSTPASPTLRYIFIRSVAAQLATKKYTAQQALDKVSTIKGKDVLTPNLTFRSSGMFNIVKLADNGLALFICGANSKATEIHTFEYFSPADTSIMSSISALEGKTIKLYAIVADVKTAGVTFPHLELRLTDTDIFVDKQ